MSIILVDDEKTYCDLMSQMLEANLGCRVVAFTRPLDALNALPTIAPSVVVTDYFMPQLNGIDFIRLATPLAPQASFLMITGHNLSSVRDEIDELRVVREVLPKPFGWRTLAEAVVRVWPENAAAPKQRIQLSA